MNSHEPYQVVCKSAVKLEHNGPLGWSLVLNGPNQESIRYWLAEGVGLQELVDKLWDHGVRPSAVKAVVEAKPANAAYVDLARLDRMKVYVRHLEGVVAGLLAGLAEMPDK